MNSNASLDPVAASTAILTLIFGPQLATYIGPYFVIIVGAMVGSAWSLGRRRVTTRFNAFQYFLLMVATALICTVPLSEIAVKYVFTDYDHKSFFAPIAMLIGGVGGDWPRLIKWMANRLWSLFERKHGGGQ